MAKNPRSFRKVEADYQRQLRGLARRIGAVVDMYRGGEPSAHAAGIITRILERYADTLTGWAETAALKMLRAVSKQDFNTWMKHSGELGHGVRREIRETPTGDLMRSLLAEQVTLIKSLPIDAAQRVHDLTTEAIADGTRAKEIAVQIAASGQVAEKRAMLIARTEVARTSSKLTEARAIHAGSEGYIWRTAGDSDVRDSHEEMNGKYVRWDTIPILSDGTHTHAGQIYNCRCYPEPVKIGRAHV